MSVDTFQTDLRLAENRLAAQRRLGFWIRLLTLGIAENWSRIEEAREQVAQRKSELIQYESLIMEANRLDDLLVQTIILNGVRISRQVFADIPVLAATDYGVDWEQLRDVVLTRDGYECQETDGYCRGPLQIHHVIPLLRGGRNDPDNLVTLCFYHHCMKHDHMRARYNGSLWC